MTAACNDIFASIFNGPEPVWARIYGAVSSDKEQRRQHRVMNIASLEKPALTPVQKRFGPWKSHEFQNQQSRFRLPSLSIVVAIGREPSL